MKRIILQLYLIGCCFTHAYDVKKNPFQNEWFNFFSNVSLERYSRTTAGSLRLPVYFPIIPRRIISNVCMIFS